MRRRRILFAENVARIEGRRLPNKVRDARRTGRRRGLCGGSGKRVDGISPGNLRAFGINFDQRTTTTQDERGWRKTAG